MAKYMIIMMYSDGTSEEIDDIFDSSKAAEEHGCYLASCCKLGGEILNLSNPGDYPLDDYDEVDFEIIEIDD